MTVEEGYTCICERTLSWIPTAEEKGVMTISDIVRLYLKLWREVSWICTALKRKVLSEVRQYLQL